MCRTDKDKIRKVVRDRYGEIARGESSGCGCAPGCCSPASPADASARLGYSAEELAALPEGADMGLGCGNPQAIAALKKGEVVLDLGSGGGLDCFLAARQVGPEGHVIGVDMTADMIGKARAVAAEGGSGNVEFRLGEIEHLPVADKSVDVILSNCVINLSPDKAQVFRDAFRVLKPGGRLAVSDVVATRELPESVQRNLDQHAGCVAGAALVSDVEAMLSTAGFGAFSVTVKEASREFIKDWFPGSGIEDYVASANIEARKPDSGAAGKGRRIIDAQIKELIAIGASVGAHCQPCLAYHVAKAKETGIGEVEIREAIAVGHRVEQGAMSAMRQFSAGIFDAQAPDGENCCSGGMAGTKGCCA
jgi:arsenite methyltransferase